MLMWLMNIGFAGGGAAAGGDVVDYPWQPRDARRRIVIPPFFHFPFFGS